ncbi:hypothetical protein Pelo_15542 [Pelomyxa schiedti]|nr:hypothetical protein Pelo_15542 [Pelomyxa schiedti]
MASWKVMMGGYCRDVTPLGGLTTRNQIGTLAAGAMVARCGRGSAMQRVMGRGHAATFVRVLWSDWVRPTITLFVLDLHGYYRRTTDSTDFTLWFTVSPLLMSLSHGPALATDKRWFSTIYTVMIPQLTPRTPSSASGTHFTTGAFNSKWMASVSSYHNRKETAATLSVAPVKGRGIWCDGACCDLEHLVVVDIPVVEPGCVAIHPYMDQSVCCEVIIAQIAERAVVVLAVDMEQTCDTKRLALLSTTRCDLHNPNIMYFSLVVLRNWDQQSPAYGSRTFIVQKSSNEIVHFAEGSSSSTVTRCDNCDQLFRLSDSVFGVSSSAKKQRGSFKLFDRDNVAQKVQQVPSGKGTLFQQGRRAQQNKPPAVVRLLHVNNINTGSAALTGECPHQQNDLAVD